MTLRQAIKAAFLLAAITLPWAAWMYFHVGYADIGVMRSFVVFVVVVTFIGVGLQNAVNVTDGLDGLAAGCSFITFVALLPLTAFAAGISTSAVLYNLMAIALCLGFLLLQLASQVPVIHLTQTVVDIPIPKIGNVRQLVHALGQPVYFLKLHSARYSFLRSVTICSSS